jgi:hypothetical protein
MPGSSESGAVPITSVTVPPDLPLEDDVDVDPPGDDDELDDELPHALRATAVTPARSTASIDLVCLCTTPPPLPRKLVVPLSAI